MRDPLKSLITAWKKLFLNVMVHVFGHLYLLLNEREEKKRMADCEWSLITLASCLRQHDMKYRWNWCWSIPANIYFTIYIKSKYPLLIILLLQEDCYIQIGCHYFTTMPILQKYSIGSMHIGTACGMESTTQMQAFLICMMKQLRGEWSILPIYFYMNCKTLLFTCIHPSIPEARCQ